MLLMAVMSSTKGAYGGVRSQGGISATAECLQSCMAGTMSVQMVKDKLQILHDDGVVSLDTHGGVTRLQLPFVVGPNPIKKRIEENAKKYSRYVMFEKDGIFSSAFEKRALDENEPACKRIKVAVCCAETRSIKARQDEVLKELDIAAPTAKDKGRIMKTLMPRVKGKADGNAVNRLVSELFA